MNKKLVFVLSLLISVCSCKQFIDIPFKIGDQFSDVKNSISNYEKGFIFCSHAFFIINDNIIIVTEDNNGNISRIDESKNVKTKRANFYKLSYGLDIFNVTELLGMPEPDYYSSYLHLIYKDEFNFELFLPFYEKNNILYLST